MSAPHDGNLVIGSIDGGRLLANLNHFSRLLRKIGFAAGADKTANAAGALCAVGFATRRDVFWALATVYVDDNKQLPIFRQTFNLFWRADKLPAPPVGDGGKQSADKTLRRLADIFTQQRRRRVPLQWQPDASGAASADAALRDKDFEQMSDAEWRAAMQCVQTLPRRLLPQPTRRRRLAATGRCDIKKTAHAAFAKGGEVLYFKRSRRRQKPPRLIVLADISASMSVYARTLAHFIAALNAGANCRLSAFLFGTELTPLSLRKQRDLDFTVADIAATTRDWEGGTRIGDSLAQFNRRWRRVLGADAIVLLATDGLECGDSDNMEKQVRRLRGSCRRLLWLNPLLRYDAYQPLAKGAAVLSRHSDDTVSIHNVNGIMQLMEALTACGARFAANGLTLPAQTR